MASLYDRPLSTESIKRKAIPLPKKYSCDAQHNLSGVAWMFFGMYSWNFGDTR
jgi:hypothetical protein